MSGQQVLGIDDFNPRPPCGGQPTNSTNYGGVTLFQSTSSVWRTTRADAAERDARSISIHVLRVEDNPKMLTCFSASSISIHVLRVEDNSKNREKSLFAFI